MSTLEHDIVMDRPDFTGVDSELSGREKEIRAEVEEQITDPEDALLSTRTKNTAKSLRGLKKEMGDRGEAYETSVKSFERAMEKFRPSGRDGDAATEAYRDIEGSADGEARVDIIYDEAYRGALAEVCTFADEYMDQVKGNEKLAFAMHYYVSVMSSQEPFEQPNFRNDFVRLAMDTEDGPGMSREEATNLRDALLGVSEGYPVPFNKFVEDNEFDKNTTPEEDKETAREAKAARHEKWGELIDVFDGFIDEQPGIGKWERFQELPETEELAIGANPWANWQSKHAEAGGQVIDLTGANVAEAHTGFWGGTKYKPYKSNSVIRLQEAQEIVEHDGVQYIKKVKKAVTVYSTAGIKEVRGKKQAYSRKINGMTHEGRGLISEWERLQQMRTAVESDGAYLVPGLNSEGEMVAHKMDANTYWRSVRVLQEAVESHMQPPPPGGQKYEDLKRAELEDAREKARSTRRKQFIAEIAGGDFTSLRAERAVNSNFNARLEALENEDPRNEHLIRMMQDSQRSILKQYQELDANFGSGRAYSEIAEERLTLRNDEGIVDLEVDSDEWNAALEQEKEEVAKEYFYRKIILNETAVELRKNVEAYKDDPETLNRYLVNLDHRVNALVRERVLTEDLNASVGADRQEIDRIRHQIKRSMSGVLRSVQSFEDEHAGNVSRLERVKKEHMTSMAELRSYLEVTGVSPRAWADVADRYEILGPDGSGQDVERYISDWEQLPEQVVTRELSVALDVLEDYDADNESSLASIKPNEAADVPSRDMTESETQSFIQVYGRKPTPQELAVFRYNERRFNSRATTAMAAGRVAELDRIFDYIDARDDAGEELTAEDLATFIRNGLDSRRREQMDAEIASRNAAQEVGELDAREQMAEANRYAEGTAYLTELQNRRAERGDLIAADLDGLDGDELEQKEQMFEEAIGVRLGLETFANDAENAAAVVAAENETAARQAQEAAEATAAGYMSIAQEVEDQAAEIAAQNAEAAEAANTPIITPDRLDVIQNRFNSILADGSKRSRWLRRDATVEAGQQEAQIAALVDALRVSGGDASPEALASYTELWEISDELQEMVNQANALSSQGRRGRSSANALRGAVRTRLADLDNEVNSAVQFTSKVMDEGTAEEIFGSELPADAHVPYMTLARRSLMRTNGGQEPSVEEVLDRAQELVEMNRR